MRSLLALDSKMYSLRARKELVKVLVGGVDVTNLNETDWLEELSYGGELDSPLTTCDLRIRRDDEMFSLAPLNAQSRLNLAGAVIGLNKLVVVSVAIVPEGVGREFADLYGAWTEVWRGRVDSWDESTNPMTVKCRDISCEVADLFIEKLKCYAVGKMAKGVNVWYAGLYAKVGDLIVPSSQPQLGTDFTRVYRCTGAGTTNNNEPTWPEELGTPVDDGGATWERVDPTPASWQANHLYNLGDLVVEAPPGGYSGVKFINNWPLGPPAPAITIDNGKACDLKNGSAMVNAVTDIHLDLVTGLDTTPLWTADAGHPLRTNSWRVTALCINAAGSIWETAPFNVSQVRCVGYPLWNQNTDYVVGDKVSLDMGSGRYYECIEDHRDILPNGSLHWGYWSDALTEDPNTHEKAPYYTEALPAQSVLSGDRPLKLDWSTTTPYVEGAYTVLGWRVYRSRDNGAWGLVAHTTVPSWTDYAAAVPFFPDPAYRKDATANFSAQGVSGVVAAGIAASTFEPAGSRYFCIPLNGEASGVSGNSQPIWPVSLAGSSFADGAVKWILLPDASDGGIAVETILAGMLQDHALDLGVQVPYIWTPSTSGYWRNPFYVQQQSLLEALRLLAQEIGWDVRLKYNPAATDHATWGRWRLCFSVPDRAKESADLTLTSDEYSELPRVESSVQTIRNVIAAAYSNSRFTFQDGTPLREWYQEEDAASIAKYGRRYMGIACSLTNFVNTYEEAQAVVRACLADLKDPLIDTEVVGPYRWNVEFGDILCIAGNWYHFTGDQRLGVYGFRHTLSNKGSCTSRLTLRGKPSIGVMRWHAMGVGPGQSKGSNGKKPAGAAKGSIVVSTTPTGAKVKFQPPVVIDGPPVGPPGPGDWAESELHLSVDAGFTPSESTLAKRQGRCSTFDVTGLTPKTLMYGKVVLVDGAGQRSPPSEEFTVTPRQARLSEMDDELKVLSVVLHRDDTWRQLSTGNPLVSAVPYENPSINIGNGWVQGAGEFTGKFVAPYAGSYRFFMQVMLRHALAMPDPPEWDIKQRMLGAQRFQLGLYKNDGMVGATAIIYGAEEWHNPEDEFVMTLGGVVAMAVGDTVNPVLYMPDNSGALSIWQEYKANSQVGFLHAERIWAT